MTAKYPSYQVNVATSGRITISFQAATVINCIGQRSSGATVNLPTSSGRSGNPSGTENVMQDKVWIVNETGQTLTVAGGRLIGGANIEIADNERGLFEYVGSANLWVGGVFGNN